MTPLEILDLAQARRDRPRHVGRGAGDIEIGLRSVLAKANPDALTTDVAAN